MTVLKAMEQEFQEIVNDIKLHPDHRNDYDLVGCMKAIEKESNRCILKEVYLFANNEKNALDVLNSYVKIVS